MAPLGHVENSQIKMLWHFYNQFYNILKLLGVLLNFPFTTTETMGDYYL